MRVRDALRDLADRLAATWFRLPPPVDQWSAPRSARGASRDRQLPGKARVAARRRGAA